MKDSLTTFFLAFIVGFIFSAFTVRWDEKNPIQMLRDTWVHYGLFTTNGVFYGLAVMGGKDLGRYVIIPCIKKIIIWFKKLFNIK
jgi:quinol-cytochrome oxidoreductase complex cytochrome b subunit